MAGRCYIVPPHLLQAIADSEHNSESTRAKAKASLASHNAVTKTRKESIGAVLAARQPSSGSSQPFVPAHILSHIAESDMVDEAARERAKRALAHSKTLAERTKTDKKKDEALAAGKGADCDLKDSVQRAVYDAKHSENETDLPGKLVRGEGQVKVKDKAVNEAYDNVGTVLDFYKTHFKWKSIDNKNMKVVSSVHFGKEYENAFWDSDVRQMVFGDGGEFLNNFTGCIDVIGHEMTHAITEHTSPLDYQGQPGALNEHVSDVFGIMVKQKLQNEKSDKADWLIGEDCILPGVKGVALRSMKTPGNAYDDPRFGKDPQVDNMSDFKDMYEDNGGVHIFSGIPNKAFYLVAKACGGYSWEKAGQIWWKALQSGKIPPKCTFLQFADVTVESAKEAYDEETAKKVRKAWTDVGVIRGVWKKSDNWCSPL